MDDEGFLTPDEVAVWLRVHVQTLAKWRTPRFRRDLPWTKVGGRIRYARRDVEAFIRAHSQEAEPREVISGQLVLPDTP